MKTVQQLKEFFASDLRNDICALEKQRLKIVRKITICWCIMIPIALVFAVIMMSSAPGPIFLIVPLVICVIISSGLSALFARGYKTDFKNRVIKRLVEFIDPGLRYDPQHHLSKHDFMASDIFKTKPNIFKGDDYVTGTIGSTKLSFCELNAKYESGSGKNRTVQQVFKGMFFIADFNKNFRTKTVVLPDTAERLFGYIGKMMQSANLMRGELIKLEDPEFERHFVVYGDDQIQARYILSTSLMKRIVDFKNKTARKIYLSFAYSKIFVAVSYNKNLFEPKLFRTLLNFEPIREYFEDLQLAVGLVEDLNLNTRIWSKQ